MEDDPPVEFDRRLTDEDEGCRLPAYGWVNLRLGKLGFGDGPTDTEGPDPGVAVP